MEREFDAELRGHTWVERALNALDANDAECHAHAPRATPPGRWRCCLQRIESRLIAAARHWRRRAAGPEPHHAGGSITRRPDRIGVAVRAQ